MNHYIAPSNFVRPNHFYRYFVCAFIVAWYSNGIWILYLYDICWCVPMLSAHPPLNRTDKSPGTKLSDTSRSRAILPSSRSIHQSPAHPIRWILKTENEIFFSLSVWMNHTNDYISRYLVGETVCWKIWRDWQDFVKALTRLRIFLPAARPGTLLLFYFGRKLQFRSDPGDIKVRGRGILRDINDTGEKFTVKGQEMLMFFFLVAIILIEKPYKFSLIWKVTLQ